MIRPHNITSKDMQQSNKPRQSKFDNLCGGFYNCCVSNAIFWTNSNKFCWHSIFNVSQSSFLCSIGKSSNYQLAPFTSFQCKNLKIFLYWQYRYNIFGWIYYFQSWLFLFLFMESLGPGAPLPSMMPGKTPIRIITKL